MLQHATERDNLTATLVDAIANNLVIRVIGRSYIVQGAILVGLFDTEFEDIKTIIHLEVSTYVTHVQGIETSLCLPECCLHLAGLQHLVWMIRRHTQRLPAINNIFSQSQSQRSDAFFRFLIAYGIIVERAQHAREVGIVMLVILLAHHFLEDDSHLLLVNDIGCCRHVCL